MKNLLFIGAACVDVVIYLKRLPKTEEDIHPDRQIMSLGGCACNAASAAKQVSDNVYFAGPVGTGVFGELTEKFLKERGLPVRIRTEEENGCCYCFVEEGGERTFLSVHGAEYTFRREWLRELDQIGMDYVYVSGLEIEEKTGDTHAGTLLGCLSKGMDWEKSLLTANKMAARTVGTEGAVFI